ncbi:MAG: hypothetical protein ACMXYG_06585 [Candidatus Woesearchaeota archaeon]
MKQLIYILIGMLLITPVFAYATARENYYRSTDTYDYYGRTIRVQNNPHSHTNYIVDYYDGSYPRTQPVAYVQYERSTYGRVNDASNTINSRNHAHYTTDQYGSVRYVDTGSSLTQNSYGVTTASSTRHSGNYVTVAYGTGIRHTNSNVRYTTGAYGTGQNQASMRGETLTRSAYGSGQPQSGLHGYTYVQPHYYSRTVDTRNQGYRVSYTPIGTSNSNHIRNYEYSVNIHHIRNQRYKYDNYPFY